MEQTFPLPTKYTITPLDGQAYAAEIRIEPLYPGYGTTLGNALRRVLLSSLEGAAITAVRIDGVQHEFSTIPAVKEDVVTILLNLKLVRLKLLGQEPATIELKAKGEKKVFAKELKLPATIELLNPGQLIATLTDKNATFELEVTVEKGLGYLPVESREKEKLPVGSIAIDAIFTPVKMVNYEVEHVRVGQRTDYDSVVLTIATDGSVSPEEALRQATVILSDHFAFILSQEKNAEDGASPEASAEEEEEKPLVGDGPDEDQEKMKQETKKDDA